jgi:hypothetical protein
MVGQLATYATNGVPLWTRPFKGEDMACVSMGFPGNVREADDEGTR